MFGTVVGCWTHATGGNIFKITSGVVACSTRFGMALACPLAVVHIGEHCKEVGATPGTPVMPPFVLSASSQDQELREISAMRMGSCGIGLLKKAPSPLFLKWPQMGWNRVGCR